MTNMNRIKPIVVVLGATGTGKSNLGLKIASKFKGEIISADSMQIYKGMDIVTNKVKAEEREAVPHHMMDFLDPSELYSVLDFSNSTLPIIRRLHEEGKLPVIVGGTHFYVESVLWKMLIGCESDKNSEAVSQRSYEALQNIFSAMKGVSECNTSAPNKSDIIPNPNKMENVIESKNKSDLSHKSDANKSDIFGLNYSDDSGSAEIKSGDITHGTAKAKCLSFLHGVPNADLVKLLEKVDPETASILHPNDRRRTISSLHRWAQTGVSQSEQLRQQRDEAGGVSLGGTIRFPNTSIFWITCDQEVLDARLDARVDSMIEEGLLQEISKFHAAHNAPALQKLEENLGGNLGCDPFKRGSPLHNHYTKGILQCIGFKEFHQYLVLSEEQRLSENGQKFYMDGISKMKMKTRQYSRQQLRWIKNRFIVRDRQKIPVYTVNGTDAAKWEEEVTEVTDEVVGSVLEGRVPSTAPCVMPEVNQDLVKPDTARRFCEICKKHLLGKYQWDHHVKSVGHRLTAKKRSYSEAKTEARSQAVQQEENKTPGKKSKMAEWLENVG